MAKNTIAPIDARTWCIEEMNGMVYGFVLVGDERAALIDTGFGTCDYLKLARTVTDKPIDVINTHGHLDHISQDASFEKVYIHPADRDILREHCSRDVRTAFLTGMFTEKGVPEWLASATVRLLFGKACSVPVKVAPLPVSDGEIIDLGGRPLEIIHVPGHTPGSICILDINSRFLFSGDMVCDEGVLLNFDHSCSVKVFRESMLKLKAMEGRWDKIWPAHHIKPITSLFIDDYIACADEILAGEINDDENGSGIKLHKIKSIGICYTANKL